MAARPNAECDKDSCKLVYVVAEFRVRTRIIERRVFESRLIREVLYHRVEDFRKGFFDQQIFFPDVISRARSVFIVGFLLPGRVVERREVCRKLRENNIRVGKLAHPFGIPFERQIPVVVDRSQSHEQFSYGKSALADKARLAGVVAVFYVNMSNVCAEVFDRFVRRFFTDRKRIIEIPKCAERIGCERVEKIAQI